MAIPQSTHPHLLPQFPAVGPISAMPAAQPGQVAADEASGQSTPRWREVLELWLRWSEAYEQMAVRMYQAAHDQAKVEDIADQVDQLRQEALAATREVLEPQEKRTRSPI